VAVGENKMRMEAKKKFGQDHNIHRILVVFILSLELGGMKIQEAPHVNKDYITLLFLFFIDMT
jgi:hypothetical protein